MIISQVDYFTADVKEVSSYFASLLLWKWKSLFHEASATSEEGSGGGGGGPISSSEASRLVAEALDAALLPLLPCVHALHSAQVSCSV